MPYCDQRQDFAANSLLRRVNGLPFQVYSWSSRLRNERPRTPHGRFKIQWCYDWTMSRTLLLRAAFLVLSTLCFSAGWSGGVASATNRSVVLPPLNAVPEICPLTKDRASRMRCYERLGLDVAQAGAPSGPAADDAWRLMRTPDPAGGHDAISITRTADIAKSDLEFAGLMLRCGERSVEVLIVLVRAIPPRVHPEVKLTAGSSSVELTASVVPPDVLLLLPRDATALASGAWQASTELAVTVEDEPAPIRGVVSLMGIGHALALLKSNCPAQ
jgi:hypothetical protein